MIEKLVTSKTRIKILNLFLSHIDDRYYLRELERMLDESLSPLRRQLVKLTNTGILIIEEEANLKYYRLNKNFEGLEELKRMVLDQKVLDWANKDGQYVRSNSIGSAQYPSSGHGSMTQEQSREETTASIGNEVRIVTPRQFRYDLVLLSFVSIFVLMTAMFVVYANNKNIKQVTKLISKETVLDSASAAYSTDRSNNIGAELTGVRFATPTGNGEMVSKKWKVIPGNIPVLSSGGTGE